VPPFGAVGRGVRRPARVIDPSDARCLLDAEMSDLIATRVGAIRRRTEPSLTYTLPAGAFLTGAGPGQPDPAIAALRAELAGGRPPDSGQPAPAPAPASGPRTGFRPASTGTGITVTFNRAIMASTRER